MEEIQVNTIETQDTREGTPQVLSNIDSWAAIADSLKTTLGPYGRDKMFLVNGEILITNDGATILKNMKIEHPAGRLLAAISESQDKEVGDGTTSVVLLACSILEQLKPLIKDSLDIKFIKNTLQEIQGKCLERLQNCKIDFNDDQFYSMAQTSLTSKILKYDKCKFADMIVNTFKQIEDIDDTRLVGIKKVSGGSISDSEMVDGVAFEKCFTYAGYEQQPKRIENPKIICLNVELEWKQERVNCEVRLKSVEDYQAIVDAEWKLVRDKLDRIIDTGANVVLSSLPVGDYATQYFARKNIFCAGRVAKEDLFRIVNACGGKIYNSTNFLKIYGTCTLFEEKQVGKLRYNYLSGGTKKAYTLIIRGPGEDVLNEVERSVNDAVMVVKRTLRNKNVVTGGGSTEMELSKYVREEGKSIAMKSALVYLAVARAFEIIPYQLAKNFGQDAIEIIQQLRYEHSNDKNHSGVNIKKGTSDMLEDGVLEPLLVKSNMIKASFNAVSALLMVDATIVSKDSIPPKQNAIRQPKTTVTFPFYSSSSTSMAAYSAFLNELMYDETYVPVTNIYHTAFFHAMINK